MASDQMAPDLSFGPPNDRWFYNRTNKTYDLTRGSKTSAKIKTTQGPEDTYITICPSLSALVIVDMQNFFLHPSCRDHPTGLAAVEPTLRMISKCRELGVQIIWLNWGLTTLDLDNMPASVLRGFARAVIVADPSGTDPKAGLGVDLGDGIGRTLCAGEWNSEIYAPLAEAVHAEDIHCAKNRMSGLWSETQPLWTHLTESKKKTLLFTGVNTDQCVLGTLANAYNAGWDCVLVEDCCGTTTKYGEEVCLWNIGKNYGFVIDSKTFTAA